jgi:beta-galactosidase
MTSPMRWAPWFTLVLLLLAVRTSVAAEGRERICMDRGWRFALGHAWESTRDFGHNTGYFSYLAKTGYGDGPHDARERG